MNCREMEERIALRVSGDMDPRDERLVEAHLAVCESCARLAAELREDLEEIQALRAEPADEGALASVRLSVLAEIESQRARTLSPIAWVMASSNLRWAAAAAAILFVVIAGSRYADDAGSPRPMTELAGGSGVPQQPVELTSKPAAKGPTLRPPKAAPIHARALGPALAARPHRSAVRPERSPLVPESQAIAKHVEIIDSNANGGLLSPPATLVKLQSSDPDVVLYWLVESNGG
jgi:hypothetical protein